MSKYNHNNTIICPLNNTTTYFGKFTRTSGTTVNLFLNNFTEVIFVGRYGKEPRKKVHDYIINISFNQKYLNLITEILHFSRAVVF